MNFGRLISHIVANVIVVAAVSGGAYLCFGPEGVAAVTQYSIAAAAGATLLCLIRGDFRRPSRRHVVTEEGLRRLKQRGASPEFLAAARRSAR